jgi:multidrug resistance efflux pump
MVSVWHRWGLPLAGLVLTVGLAWQVAASHGQIAGWSHTRDRETSPGSVFSSRIIAEGRVVAYPGAEVEVGTEVGGLIVSLPVSEKTQVRRGDLIAELRADDLKAERAEAEAQIAEFKAEIRFFEREVRREESLLTRRSGTPRELDEDVRALDTARARLAAAQARRDQLDACIAKTRIVSPIDGVVMSRAADPGETIPAGALLVTIVDLRRLRIEAEVDEFDSGRVPLGAHVIITAEGYDPTWKGIVEEIPDAVVPRRLRPQDPGRPIDAQVLPVKIAWTEVPPWKLGQRVEVSIAIEDEPEPVHPDAEPSSPRVK